MIVIISDVNNEGVGKALYNYLISNNEEVEFISASERNIKPCYCCDGCTYKTYGKCVVRDDMDQILPIIIKGDIVVYTSPLIWGGFSYDIKKILDKTALIGNRFYKTRNKEIVKGTISNNKKIIGIGVSEIASKMEQSSFEYFLKEVGTIMNIEYLGKVVNPTITDDELQNLAREVLL
ncbi:NAD(P)H-dependent oxidoreductase [Tissierella sp.]|uniref:NAD(P)H-dependent oxidoreductase n=1 Tax=Tissierella sp. TaxID=41274 RepID=UPI002867AE74|nr:NAD(P)H-dependent oxidoreductase [Tissierella sp.]MDR7855540.1 NAD(P)H-dependent oxidoreductase [Tissierella sp.]